MKNLRKRELLSNSNNRDYSKEYLTFTALATGSFTFNIPSGVTTSYLTSVSYSLDNGSTWTTRSNSNSYVTVTTPTVNAGDTVLWKGICSKGTSDGSTAYAYFGTSYPKSFKISGNVMSMLYGDNFADKTEFPSISSSSIKCLFGGLGGGLTSIEGLVLPATLLTPNNCYKDLFKGCIKLTTLPNNLLPATNLWTGCYSGMFDGCIGLKSIPSGFLPSTLLSGRCYEYMFRGCTDLIDVPSDLLPATTMYDHCYYNMFNGCIKLTKAPDLPADSLRQNCYENMFLGCIKLNYIKAMFTTTPGTNVTRSWLSGVAYSGIFIKNPLASWDVRGVNGVPSGWVGVNTIYDYDNFPTTTDTFTPQGYVTFTANEPSYIGLVSKSTNQTLYISKDHEHWAMLDTTALISFDVNQSYYVCGNLISDNTSSNYTRFFINGSVEASGNCNAIWNYSNLNAELKLYCGYYMFNGCSGLTSIDYLVLSSTTLANYCYSSMFYGCTGLTSIPSGLLPAITLSNYCYQCMFKNCKGLITLPSNLLPATTLTIGCYYEMFYECTGLTSVPSNLLPATTLANQCYFNMFRLCNSLVIAPELPATTLVSYCYEYMFNGCSSLNYIKCLATDVSASDCTYGWVTGVASSGTFVKEASANFSIDIHGIPKGWVISTIGIDNPLTFTALENGKFTLTIPANVNTTYLTSVSYSVDNGVTWVTTNNTNSQVTVTTPTIQTGSTVLWKGLGNRMSIDSLYKTNFSSTGRFNVSGNIMSLLYDDNFADKTAFPTSEYEYIFGNLFSNCGKLVSAANLILPVTTLARRCYYSMFSGCTSLTTAPFLPATTLAIGCYSDMFYNCQSLTKVPRLSATSIPNDSYLSMFEYCTSLTNVPSNLLPATTLASRCYESMFLGCTGLTNAPSLPTETLAQDCYENMFYECTKLTTAPYLPAETLVYGCYYQMFYGCSKLNYIECMATDISANACTTDWMYGVAATGTFCKASGMEDWTTGSDGIPSGWDVS